MSSTPPRKKAAPPPLERVCANCGTRGTTGFLQCGKCKTAKYCSRTCQREHWKRSHKRDCTRAVEQQQEGGGDRNAAAAAAEEEAPFTVEEAIEMQKSGQKGSVKGYSGGGGVAGGAPNTYVCYTTFGFTSHGNGIRVERP